MNGKMINSRKIIFFLLVCTVFIEPYACQVGKVQACGHALYTWLVQACLPKIRGWNLTAYRPYYEGFFDRGEGPTLVEMCCNNRCDYPVLYGYQKCELLIPHGVNVG
ncbi:uncharacterized protein LOC111618715 [Centruroides sculpturatus]|uniref:uncharacterized protein LOC111618715 n=1 Tax=Centruroides sculpturatus TaxID=218467 RepID=UPI000C6E97FB|nr:uncharacterized protein LOC111618715 [Centruroides sculpturatus]